MESDEECIFGLTEIKTWRLKITVQKKKKMPVLSLCVSVEMILSLSRQKNYGLGYSPNTTKTQKKIFANKILLIIHYLLDPCKDCNNFYTACHIKIEIHVQTQPETDTIAQKDANH